MNATHTITGSHIRLSLIEVNDKGSGIFKSLDCPGRVCCPMTPEYVLPYANRSTHKEIS